MLNVFSIFTFISIVVILSGGGYVYQKPMENSREQISGISTSCRLNYNGQVGVCQKFSQCPSAQYIYNTERRPPIYCQFNRENPVVCCPSIPNESIAPIKVAEIVPQNLEEIDSRYFYPSSGQDRATSTSQLRNCRLSDGKTGVCRRYSTCPEAQSAFIQRRIVPIYCEYDRKDPFICCETVPVTVPTTPVDRGSEGSISEKKCEDFYFPKPIPGSPVSAGGVGGVPAEPDEFPLMAAIGYRKDFGSGYDYRCGGTVIAPNYILSAAHCASVGGAPPDVARIGGNSLSGKAGSYPEIPIKQIYIHPDYNRRQIYNDIAIFELSYSSIVDPACLWTTFSISVSETTAIGYGATKFGGSGSQDLIKVMLKIFPNEVCKRFFPAGTFRVQDSVLDSQICAGDPLNKMDTCQGDSGGPLLVKMPIRGKEIFYILGITSFGQGCAGGPPSLYTRVSSYLNWIEKIVWSSQN